MTPSTLLSHFQSLFASGEHATALEQLQKLATSIPVGATRDRVNELLQSEPTPWQDVVLLLEQSMAALKEELKSNVLLVIGNESYAFQNIIGSIINIIKVERKPVPKELNAIDKIDLKHENFGREEELEKLYNDLNPHQKLAESSNKPILIHGLGGIGKTNLASAYLVQKYDEYKHLAWIKNIKGKDFISTITEDQSLIKSLIESSEEFFTQNVDQTERFEKLMEALRVLPGPNLLVVDNVYRDKTTEKFFEKLPKAPGWKVLVTSRQKDLLLNCKSIELQKLKPEDALTLFCCYYQGGSQDDVSKLLQNDVSKLLEKIDYHTFTIVVLAKILKRNQAVVTISELMDKLNTSKWDDPELIAKINNRGCEYNQSLLRFLVGLFPIKDLNEEELLIMQQFAVLPNKPLEVKKLAEWMERNPIELNKILAELEDRAWLSKRDGKFLVHVVVQEVIKFYHEPLINELHSLINSLSEGLTTEVQPTALVNNFYSLEYAETVAEHFAGTDILPEQVSTLWNNLAAVLTGLGNYTRAEKLLEKTLFSNQNNFGEDHHLVALSFNNLAVVYYHQKRYQKAKDALQMALSIAEKTLEKDDIVYQAYAENLKIVSAVPPEQDDMVEINGKFTLKNINADDTFTITRSLFAKQPLSFEEYNNYCIATGQNQPEAKDRGQNPVTNISWFDAVKYCNWRSRMKKLKEVYTINNVDDHIEVTGDWSADGYRLPTGAEWAKAKERDPKIIEWGWDWEKSNNSTPYRIRLEKFENSAPHPNQKQKTRESSLPKKPVRIVQHFSPQERYENTSFRLARTITT